MKQVVSDFYKLGYYTKEDVAVFVRKGKLTQQEYEKITAD